MRPLFVCAKKADAFRFNILAGFFHSNQLEVWCYSVCSLQNIRALCTVEVPERVRFWHENVHLLANHSSALLSRRAVID